MKKGLARQDYMYSLNYFYSVYTTLCAMARVMVAGVQTVFIITELLGDGMAHDIPGSPHDACSV